MKQPDEDPGPFYANLFRSNDFAFNLFNITFPFKELAMMKTCESETKSSIRALSADLEEEKLNRQVRKGTTSNCPLVSDNGLV